MRRAHAGRPAVACLPFRALLVMSIGSVLAPVGPALADSLAPKKKDSPARFQPKTAELTTRVEPAEARAGDTVTLKVTAKLQPGFHIYKYSKTPMPPGQGPSYTTFDLFDAGGLIVEGDWTDSREPIRHKEAVWPDLPFVEYYEDEVTWSIKLKLPGDAATGKKALRVQAGYMVCNAMTCSIDGRWTLPPANLTVLPGRGGSSAPAAAAATRKKDTPARFQPKTAELTTAVEPAEARPGDEVTLKVTAKLQPGYHIYKYSKTPMPPGEGPSDTTFLLDTGGLEVEGDWSASREPIRHKEAVFPNLPFVEYYEDEVTWAIKLKVPAGAAPGKKELRVQAGYMVCNAQSCSIPGQWTLPPATLTILPADGLARPSRPTTEPVAAAPEKSSSHDAGKAPAPPESPKDASAVATPAPPASGTTTSDSSAPVGSSEIATLAQQGLIPFLLASALGGLFALVMPCVWPMVPITVNFFVKQGQGQGGRNRATGLAIIYCLSIIGVFTAVGVLCSFFFSAAALPRLANNPWLNLFVAALFILFGLSLLGLFEIRLPSFLLNASAKGEGRGGLVGVIFMALTLTITSFTCTFPVVGGLLVMAASGSFFYPIIGLATFATVIALPFFLLALSPNLISKMPRSGDWMNAVKVVGGLIEIGAALKFINTAELAYVTPQDAWFNAYVILTCWVVLALVCGFYLLGMFRTDHDHDDVKVGPGRLVSGALFLGLGLYLAPALFGHPPQGRIWIRLIVGLLPPDVSELSAGIPLAGGGAEASPMRVKATSTDPDRAEREEKNFHGVQWGMSLEQAREQAAKENRPILIDFTGVNCSNCRNMESGVFPRPEVVDLLKKFVTVQLYTDFVPIASLSPDQRERLADKNKDRLLDFKLDPSNPKYVILSPSGQVLGAEGYTEAPNFVRFLSKGLEKASQAGGTKVAQSGTRDETDDHSSGRGR